MKDILLLVLRKMDSPYAWNVRRFCDGKRSDTVLEVVATIGAGVVMETSASTVASRLLRARKSGAVAGLESMGAATATANPATRPSAGWYTNSATPTTAAHTTQATATAAPADCFALATIQLISRQKYVMQKEVEGRR